MNGILLREILLIISKTLFYYCSHQGIIPVQEGDILVDYSCSQVEAVNQPIPNEA